MLIPLRKTKKHGPGSRTLGHPHPPHPSQVAWEERSTQSLWPGPRNEIVQWVERRTHTSMVGGSTPPLIPQFQTDALAQHTSGRTPLRKVTRRDPSTTSESPPVGNHTTHHQRGELKHLSTLRNRNQPRFRQYWRKTPDQTPAPNPPPPNTVEAVTRDGDSPVRGGSGAGRQ